MPHIHILLCNHSVNGGIIAAPCLAARLRDWAYAHMLPKTPCDIDYASRNFAEDHITVYVGEYHITVHMGEWQYMCWQHMDPSSWVTLRRASSPWTSTRHCALKTHLLQAPQTGKSSLSHAHPATMDLQY